MLTRLVVRRMRLLADVAVDLEPGRPLVVLGPSSSGKSTLLEALDLFAAVSGEGVDRAADRRGGYENLQTLGQSDSIELVATLRSDKPGANTNTEFRYGLRVGQARPRGPAEIEREWFDTSDNGATRSQVQVIAGDASMVAFYHPKDGSSSGGAMGSHDALLTARRTLADLRIYPAFVHTPAWWRDAREGPLPPRESAVVAESPVLDRRGIDLINTLHHLHSHADQAWEALLFNLKAVFPTVGRVEFPAAPNAAGRITLAWRDERFPTQKLLPSQLSEGVVRWLSLLAALLSPWRPAMIAFDDLEQGLDAAMYAPLAHLLLGAAARGDVVATTRSPELARACQQQGARVLVATPTATGTRFDP
jgi:predicted ATPase